MRPRKKAPDRLFNGKFVVMQHLVTCVNLRCGLATLSIAPIARGQCGLRVLQAAVDASGLLLGKASSSTHQQRNLDEDLEACIGEDHATGIAAVGDNPKDIGVFAQTAHALSEGCTHRGVIRNF